MKLSVTVEQIYYPKQKPDVSRFFIIIKTNSGIVKGQISWWPTEYERLILEGDYEIYQGQKQFKFRSALPDIPEDPRAVLHYVCTLTPGIGDALEEKIWELLGEDWPKIQPGDVKGMTEKRIAALREKIEYVKRNTIQVNIISWLMSKGCTFNLAQKAWDKWEKETMGIISSNVYRLTELKQVGFLQIDNTIRHSFGITDVDERRIMAGIDYAIIQILQDGSTVALWDNVFQVSRELLNIDGNLIVHVACKMIQDSKLILFNHTTPERITRKSMYDNELILWEFLKCS